MPQPTNPAPGNPFWDPDLFQRMSGTKPKRGSIMSRGTLVVVRLLNQPGLFFIMMFSVYHLFSNEVASLLYSAMSRLLDSGSKKPSQS